jgi:hypothetical protein
MVNIKKFIDKVSAHESRGGSVTFVMSVDEARMLRDEVSKLITDNYELLSNKQKEEKTIQVEINSGKW